MGSAKTRFTLSNERFASIKADSVILPVFKKTDHTASKTDKKSEKNTNYAASILWPIKLDKALLDEINALAMDEKFDGGKGKLLTVRANSSNKLGARRLIILGLGDAEKLQAKHWEGNLQKAYSTA